MHIFASRLQLQGKHKIMSDSELNSLIEKIKQGDRESFNKVFRRFYAPMIRFCFRFVADSDIAAEVVQDFFVKLWTNRDKLNINTSFESYMMRSIQNGAITYINKERAHSEINLKVYTEEGEANDPSQELQSKNLETAYRKILANMPEKRRIVFQASRFDGMKYAEIAEKYNMSQKTVEAHMSAAIKQLKEGLKDYI